jgi:hypothetical protein
MMRYRLLRCAPRIGFIMAGLASCMAVIACGPNVDLNTVRELDRSAAAAEPSFAAIAHDYAASCIRLGIWTFAATKADTGSIESKCKDSQLVADQWEAMNAIILRYVRALGALAGVVATETDYGTQIDALVKKVSAIGPTPIVAPAQLTDFVGLGTSLVRAYSEARRKGAVAKFAKDADAYVHMITVEILQPAAQEHYATQLDIERAAVDTFFERALVNLLPGVATPGASPQTATPGTLPQTAPPGLSPADTAFQALQLKADWGRERQVVEDKRVAITAYVAMLNDIAGANAALSKGAAMGPPEDVIQHLQVYVPDFENQISKLKAAFPE